MNAEELVISRSTPNYRFDPIVEPEAKTFVAQTIDDSAMPVVVFALEWCEFCRAAHRLFARHGVAYRSVDLDSVEYQKDDRGGKIRAALGARTSITTIPQILVGGELIGGCSDLMNAYRSGKLQRLLDNSRVDYDRSLKLDPDSFLPGWVHKR